MLNSRRLQQREYNRAAQHRLRDKPVVVGDSFPCTQCKFDIGMTRSGMFGVSAVKTHVRQFTKVLVLGCSHEVVLKDWSGC